MVKIIFFSESFKNCRKIKKNSLFWKRLETIQNKVKTILNFRNKRKINAIILNISEWYVIKWIYYEMISKYDSLVLRYKFSQNNLFPFYSEIIRKNFRIKWKNNYSEILNVSVKTGKEYYKLQNKWIKKKIILKN